MKTQNLEKEIISCLAEHASHKSIAYVANIISGDDFEGEKEKKIFNVFIKNFVTGDKDWWVTSMKQLLSEGINTIKEYGDEKGSLNDVVIVKLAEELRERNRKTKINNILKESNNKLFNQNSNDFILDLQKDLSKVFESKREDTSINSAIKEFEKIQEDFSDKIVNGQDIIGIPTQFKKIDKIIDGLRSEHIWILGGYQGSGKTFFALNIMANLIDQKKRNVFYSLEMSKVDILGRLLGIITGVNGITILKGITDKTQFIKEAKQKIIDSKMSVVTDCHHLNEIKISMLQENMKQKVDLFVIDYLQIIQSDKQDDYSAIRNNIIELQSFAKQIKAPIIVLSQISNEQAKTRNDRMMGFKGAGDIGAVADFAIELQPNDESENYRDDMNKGKSIDVKVKIKKNRHGNAGEIDFTFNSKNGRFLEKQDTK